MKDDRIEVGAAVPGWVLRLLAVVVAAAAMWMLQLPWPLWIACVLGMLIGAVRPATFLLWAGLAGVPLSLLLAEPHAGRTAVALLAVHLVHVLASLAQTILAAATVQLRALRPTVARLIGVQLIAQAVAAAAMLLPAPGAHGIAWAAVLGAAAVGALVLGAMHMLRSTGADAKR